MEPELIADYACTTGEGPLWHPDEQRLYWVDIPAGKLFRYDPASGKHEQVLQNGVIGGFTIQSDGSLLLFQGKGAIRIWRNGELQTLVEEIPGESQNRFNDVAADPVGRVFCGTMASTEGSNMGRLYRFDRDGTLMTLLENIGCSNGIGFSPNHKQMYYTDSHVRKIYLFDYDMGTGSITNQRLFVEVPKGEGVPDGLTVDSEGFIWSARWDGYCVVRYAPDGREDRRIKLPVGKVSSVTFGGSDYSDMYLTTAGGDHKDREGPMAGGLFRVQPGVKGAPEFFSRIGQ